MTVYARPCRDDPEAEMAARTLARRNLLDFTTYTYPAYVPEGFHEVLALELERVLENSEDRFMVFAPPQHGKTELASVRFPAFWLAKRPDDPVMLCSYGASLAHAKSRESRNVLESPAYSILFPEIRTDPGSRARDYWRLQGERGGMVAAGVRGPITGHGTRLGIIDDPFENWEQAQSKTIRDKVWDWYRTTFRTRVWEGGIIFLICTRWHEDDLAGRLLKSQPERWRVLRLPALAETQEERDANSKRLGLSLGDPDPLGRNPGEALCPLRFSRDTLLEIKGDVGSQAWTSEYQGSPRPLEGNRFKREWFDIVKAVPAGASRVRYWDKAGTEGGGAFTAGVLVARVEGFFYVEDVVRGQWEAGKREAIIKQTAVLDRQKYGHVIIVTEQEPGSGGKESADATVRNLAGFTVLKDRVTGSKDVRMEPLAAQSEAKNVKLVEGKWNWDFLEEITSVPSGTFRDQADGAAGAFNKLATVSDVKSMTLQEAMELRKRAAEVQGSQKRLSPFQQALAARSAKKGEAKKTEVGRVTVMPVRYDI